MKQKLQRFSNECSSFESDHRSCGQDAQIELYPYAPSPSATQDPTIREAPRSAKGILYLVPPAWFRSLLTQLKTAANWKWSAQCVVVLVCAFTLKQYYSTASADQLRWILAPTAALVELVSGISFEFESYAGYISRDRSFLIAASCAGVNFLIAAFLMLSLRKLLRDRSQNIVWGFIPTAALIAYLVTLAANTARISIALRLQRMPAEIGWLNPNQLHRFEGVFIYFGFLLLLFLVSEKMSSEKPFDLFRQSFFPLLVYYATTLGIPLANSAYRKGGDFWEHSLFVLLIPLALILPLAAFRFYRRSGV